MKKIRLISLFTVAYIAGNAQTALLTPTVIASTGDYATQNSLEVSFTIGEMTAVETVGSNTGVLLTQGFHQPEEFGTVGITEIAPAEIDFVLYPNPTSSSIQTSFEMPDAGLATITVTDLNGKKLQSSGEKYTSGKMSSQIDMNTLAAGSYLLSIEFMSNNGKRYFSSKPFSIIP